MHCDVCREDKENGNSYLFYYGRELERALLKTSPTVEKITYQILGKDSIWICNTCYLKHRNQTLLYLIIWPILPLIFVFIAINMPITQFVHTHPLIGVLLGIVILILVLWTFLGWIWLLGIFDDRWIRELFRSVHNDFIKSYNVKTLFSPAEYDKLEKDQKIIKSIISSYQTPK